ncbi:MAG: glycoside hydrolase family 25 protein [Pseudomonadota bacterium]
MSKSTFGIMISALALIGAVMGGGSAKAASEFSNAWHSPNSSIVLDAYEYTPIDWSRMRNNKRLVGFINKASDGMSPTSRCGKNPLCRVKWRRYAAARELYHTRKHLAKELGLEWGAYHLARPGNPVGQAEHFLNFAEPEKDDLIALDIEHNDPTKWMSLRDAEIFSRHIKMRTGRYPVLYTNHSTAKFIAANRDVYPLLSRLNLWYARYKSSVPGVFPMGHWKSYTLWQFSSMVNCNDKTCPWRINGAGNWIDVNVVAMAPEKLRKAWPFAKMRSSDDGFVAAASAQRPADTTTTSAFNIRMKVQTGSTAMVVAGAVPMPEWRPGSTFRVRQPALFSEDVHNRHQFARRPTPPEVRTVRTHDEVVLALSRMPKNQTPVPAQDTAKNTGLFPVEAVVFQGEREELPVLGPVRTARDKI